MEWTWGCDRARFVRELHRLLGAHDGGDYVAGGGAGGFETRSSAIDAAIRRLLPGCLDAGRARRLCRVPATRVVRGRGVDGYGRSLRAYVVQACLPPALPGTSALGLRVRPRLRRLGHRADADGGRAGRHEHHLDVPDRRARTGAKALA